MVERVAVVIATFHSDFKCTIPFLQKMIRERYLNISLNPISDDDLGTLACHMLGVDAIHKGLLRFLQEKSEGNPLYIQEILMLPSLQEHYYLVPMSSISEDVLEQNFVFAEIEEDDGIHPTTLEVCNIVDLEGLSSLTVSTNLMDLVRDHATGLNPEEQMLLRKFSLFGETFGLSVLESVFPDYSSDELARKLQNLVEKNILSPACEHWRSTSTGNGSKLSLEEATQVYCIHPLKFVSDYLKRSVHSSVASDQRERLHLYMADLLKNEAGYFCDACRTEGGGRHDRKTIQCPEPFKQCKIPSIDFRLCQCSHIRMDILIQREFHLEKGNAPLAKRVDSLLDAAERGLDAGLPSEVESILGKIQRLKGSRGNVSNVPDYAVIAAKRLRAKAKISKGNIDDALRYLKDAMQNMNIVFPDDIESKAYKSKRFNGRLGSEENRCLCLGCNLLVAFGMHEEATRVAGMLEQFLMQESQENFELISARTVYLRAVTKTEVSKSREKTTFRLIGDIRQQCLKRLSELPVVDVGELEAILTAYATVVRVLFEKAEFDECKDIGHKTFHLLKILNHPRLIVQVLFWITLVHFYAGKNHKKCLELISHMQDAYEQSGDRLSQVIYQTLLIKLMREMKLSMDTSDKLKICMDYAARGCNADSFQTNHDAKIFCLSSLMAIWCLEENLPDPFPSWYNQALKLQRRVHLDNYWSLLGTSYLEMAKIMKKQEKWFALTRSEVDNFKQSFKKVIENLQIHIKKCVPVLGRCVVEIEGILRNAVKDCSGLK